MHYKKPALTAYGDLMSMDEAPAGGQIRWGLPLNVPERIQAIWPLFQNRLSEIPGVYGRLSYLASLAEEHFGLRAILGEIEMQRGLRRCHRQVFAEWLSLSLSAKKADLNSYFAGMAGHRRQIVAEWLNGQAMLARMLPAGATEAERALWAADLAVIASLLRAEHSGETGRSKVGIRGENYA